MMMEIQITEAGESKTYRKTVAGDDDLFTLIDRAAAKYGTAPDPDEPLRYARAKAMATTRSNP